MSGTTSTEQWRAEREAKLVQMGQQLNAAVEALTTGEDWTKAMRFAAQFRSRSFNNSLLIWVQHAEAYKRGLTSAAEPTYVAGYKQWKSLGRSPQAGRGYRIFAPRTARMASTTPGDPASWRRLDPYEKPRPGEVVRSRMSGSKPVTVWDVSCTTGPDIPERPRPVVVTGQAPAGLWDGLVAQVEAKGYRVELAPNAEVLHGADGLTLYDSNLVQVRSDMDDAAMVTVLAHEWAHVRMHDPAGGERDHHRGIREVEAESVAMMVAAAWGMDTATSTVPYVAGWASSVKDSTPAEVIRATGEKVRRVSLELLGALPEAPLGDGMPPGLTREVRESGTGRGQSMPDPRLGPATPLAPAEPSSASVQTSVQASNPVAGW